MKREIAWEDELAELDVANIDDIMEEFKRNPTPPVRDWGIARSLRSLGRISENTNIPAELGAGFNHQLKTDGIFVFKSK